MQGKKERKALPLSIEGVDWIEDYLFGDSLRVTVFHLPTARVDLLSGETYEQCGWFLVGKNCFRALGSLTSGEGNVFYLGHLVSRSNKISPALAGLVRVERQTLGGQVTQVKRELLRYGIVEKRLSAVVFGDGSEEISGGEMFVVVPWAITFGKGELGSFATGMTWLKK